MPITTQCKNFQKSLQSPERNFIELEYIKDQHVRSSCYSIAMEDGELAWKGREMGMEWNSKS